MLITGHQYSQKQSGAGHHPAKLSPQEGKNQEDTTVRVTDEDRSFLDLTNHVIPSKAEKKANYLKVGRKIGKRKPTYKIKLDIDMSTGHITKL